MKKINRAFFIQTKCVLYLQVTSHDRKLVSSLKFFLVLLLFIAYAASFPAAVEDDDSDLELELRSILDQLDEEQDMTRSFTQGKKNNLTVIL